jgi:exodeoxyribonuclease-3
MKIATWNVNSIRARMPNALAWLRDFKPDVVLLQETKTVNEKFPTLEFEDLGYNLALHGQKSYNGVAIFSKWPIEDLITVLPGESEDDQARYIEVVTNGVRLISVYVPNGSSVGSDKFEYKLRWFERLRAHAAELMQYEEALVIGGDYNVAPQPGDVYDPIELAGTVCFHPEEQIRFQSILNLGLTDAYQILNPGLHAYSWWDHRGGSWHKDQGMRIDHLLLSPQAADRLAASGIERAVRGTEKASDHVPVWCELAEV